MTVVRFECGTGRGKDMDGSSTCTYIFWVIRGSTMELFEGGRVLEKTKGLDGQIIESRVDLMAKIIQMTWLIVQYDSS